MGQYDLGDGGGPMYGYKYAELILLKLRCPAPQCVHQFQKVIADLVDRTTVTCPSCGGAIDIQEHKRAIEHISVTAAQLDTFGRKRP